MSYAITRHKRVIELHKRLPDAERAFWILTAHELNCGREANYELDTWSCDSVSPPEQCKPPLPQWAVDVLRRYGFFERHRKEQA